MTINWYPGHMHKARRELNKLLPEIDLVIELLDARLPFSSSNPVIASLAKHKPSLKLLSKSDLADAEITDLWLAKLNAQEAVQALPIVTPEGIGLKSITQACNQLTPSIRASRSLRALVVGIPNVGKSTLINTMAGRKVAKVGNEPAVTKRQQKVQINERLQFFDTPGILWPRIHNPESSYRLAASGAIRDTALDYEDVGFWAADFLLTAYPEAVTTRYKLESLPASAEELLTSIAQRRGGLRAGGYADLHRASEVLLLDLRAGHLGRLSLETPAQVEAELVAD